MRTRTIENKGEKRGGRRRGATLVAGVVAALARERKQTRRGKEKEEKERKKSRQARHEDGWVREGTRGDCLDRARDLVPALSSLAPGQLISMWCPP